MNKPPLLLIVNQHGDNRGDEAAMQGMITALRERLPGARFTVLHQFSAPASEIDLTDVRYLPLRVPIHEALRLSLWAALARLGIRVNAIVGPIGRQMLADYREADAVISAPGGPYFGDLYAGHEVVHWFYVWLAKLHGKKLVLYQPSSGPFEGRLLKPIRKNGFKWFSLLTVRESISANNIEQLTGRRPEIGSDSALHRRVAPAQVKPGLVTGTFRDPGDELRDAHDQDVVSAMVRVHGSGRRMMLLPQLHGPRHQDRPYLQRLADAARAQGAAVEVAQDTLSADEQRALVAASDFVLAGRYHPLVFAVSAGVPALVIPYEHKARGVAEAAGLGPYIVDLDEMGSGKLDAKLDQLIINLDAVRLELAESIGLLEQAAARTADATADLVRGAVAANA